MDPPAPPQAPGGTASGALARLPSDGGLGPCVPAEAWSLIASPFLPKYLSSPRCAALRGALYLVGDNTKKAYVYDPGANLWQKVGLSRAPRVTPRPAPQSPALGAGPRGPPSGNPDSEGRDAGAEPGLSL